MRILATAFACALLFSACDNDNDSGGIGRARLPSTSYICAQGAGAYTGSFRVAGEVLRWTGTLPHEREVMGVGNAVAAFAVSGGSEVCAWEDRRGCDLLSAPPSRADCGQVAEVRVFL